MQTLSSKVEKLARNLPINNLISNQSIQAELRWEKTKDWNSYRSLQESEVIEMQISNVGKIMVQCDYITESQIKSFIL